MTAKKELDLTATIIISNNPETVFKYLSNYTNDSKWRKEINKVKINTESVKEGTLITEESFLSRRIPNYISELTCTNFQENKSITSETTSKSLFWSKNTRIVEALPNSKTKVTYRLQFDRNIVKYGLGFGLPQFLVSYYTKATMQKYLAVLKRILEK